MDASIQKIMSKGQARYLGKHTLDRETTDRKSRGGWVLENRERFVNLLKTYSMIASTHGLKRVI